MAGWSDPDDALREERARMRAERDEALSAHARVCDALEAKRRRVEALEEALRPFLRHYQPWMDGHPDDSESGTYSRHTFGQLRRARALLATAETTR